MSEPLSREDSDFVKAVKAEAALVARLRQDRDDWELAHDEMHARFLRAEAGLAAAQEALKGLAARTFARRPCWCPIDPQLRGHTRWCRAASDALARGGGQQETGQ